MTGVLGDLLPVAVGVAISPLPIIAVILMLLAAHAGRASAGFLTGWVVGIAAATIIFAVIAASVGLKTGGAPSTVDCWLKIGLGILLVGLAAWEWIDRPRRPEDARTPKWLAAVDTITPLHAAGLAFILAAVNPKNLLLCVAAGTTIGSAGLSIGGASVAVVVFVVIAACTVAAPVLAYALAADRMRHPLDSLRDWLQAHNSAVMSVLLLVLGAGLIGKGVAAL